MNEEKHYELRDLNSTDLFLITKIIGKIGVKNFKKCFEGEDVKKALAQLNSKERNDDDLNAIGLIVVLEVVDVITTNLPACEAEIYQFLSNLSGLKIKDLQELPAVEFIEMIIDVIKKPEFKDFFKVASKLFKK